MSLNSEIFVDKSELLDVTNRYVNTQQSANYAQTECQFRYCGTAIPFLTVRSTAR